MNPLLLGVVLGLVFAGVAIVPMFQMTFSDKRAAILGAFINRFMIGFLIPNLLPSVDPILRGLLLGLFLSLPDALITKAYAPIIGLGVIGGVVAGIITRLALSA